MPSLKDIENVDSDSLLEALGVRRIESVNWLGPALGGLAVGVVAGTLLRLFLAPRSGDELREIVRQRVDDAKVAAGAVFQNAQGQAHSGSQSETVR